MALKLGKAPARPDAVKLKLVNYLDRKALPKPPKTFGHEGLIGPREWGMLGNDAYGDCVFAGAAHETMMWCKEAGTTTRFDDKSVLSDYAEVTGFDPSQTDSEGNNPTDQGTDMQAAASYRRKTGIVDADGKRHQVAAYLALRPGNLDDIFVATYLFGAVGIGIEFPGSAMDQFKAGKPWTVVRGARIEGGHYVPLVAKRSRLVCVTWGQAQPMTQGFLTKYMDEGIAYVSAEALKDGKSPEGFDAAGLMADLASLGKPVA